MRTYDLEPVRLVPRMLPRRWGWSAAPSWCMGAPRPEGAVGEIWLAHANNVTSDGRHLGAVLADDPEAMLGEMGRVPPSVRLLFASEPTDPVSSDGALSFWRLVEAPLDGVVTAREREGAPMRRLRARRGDMFRAKPGTSLSFGADMTALEVRANFAPANDVEGPPLSRVVGTLDRAARETWFRDAALSVERWTLPEISFLEPDGETCHVLMALTPGVSVDGRALGRGEAVFLPAKGRRCVVTGRGAQVLAAYPDLTPTEIWKPVRPPRPAALAIDPAALHVIAHDQGPRAAA